VLFSVGPRASAERLDVRSIHRIVSGISQSKGLAAYPSAPAEACLRYSHARSWSAAAGSRHDARTRESFYVADLHASLNGSNAGGVQTCTPACIGHIIAAAMRVALTVVFTLALVTSLIVVNWWLRPFDSWVGPKDPGVEVMVATRDLPAGIVVQEGDFRIVRVSPEAIPRGIPRKRSDVIGHKTLRTIQKGEFIHLSEVSP
jgi:hypothetical protein